MNGYSDFPPYPYFISVLKHCAESAATYLALWQSKDENHRVVCDKKKIRSQFLISPTLFRNHMLPLVSHGLISMDESPNMFVVELVSFDEEAFEGMHL